MKQRSQAIYSNRTSAKGFPLRQHAIMMPRYGDHLGTGCDGLPFIDLFPPVQVEGLMPLREAKQLEDSIRDLEKRLGGL